MARAPLPAPSKRSATRAVVGLTGTGLLQAGLWLAAPGIAVALCILEATIMSKPIEPANQLTANQVRELVGDRVEQTTWLSQYGCEKGGQAQFRSEPRWERETAVSMTKGKRSADEMGMRIRRMTAPRTERHLVRWFIAGNLLDAGYDVLHTPLHNPDHVSVAACLPADQLTNRNAHRKWCIP